LGFEHYCHFTSPIRRYPDVLVHRILQECLDQKIEPDKKLEVKCRHSSERERAAMDSERAANKYKQVEYMQGFLGEEFAGVISGVASFGFWVETVEHKCEGLVSINSLLDYDDFVHNEAEYCLVGRRSGRTFRMGDKLTIRIVAANLTKRQLDYEWVITAAEAAEFPPGPQGESSASGGRSASGGGRASSGGRASGSGRPSSGGNRHSSGKSGGGAGRPGQSRGGAPQRRQDTGRGKSPHKKKK
jgi:ribonuclease R